MKSSAALHYRPDVDGLRGVAVLLVLAFHASETLLPGGFVGVDVFFVISGYLISSLLLNDLRQQRFSLAGFYARRIKRIFPALITVLGATLVLGWLLLFPAEFEYLGKHVAGGALSLSNILLWRETSYFNPEAGFRPLLHLWSLGIEEQFYIFFPFALWFAHRKGLATARFLGILLALSFVLSLGGTQVRPVATFFLPVTRIWELLIGCLLSALEQRGPASVSGSPGPPASPLVRHAASGLGLVLIVGAALGLDKATAFPGGWALLPTVGTALVIAAGRDAPLNRRFLGNRLLVAVGLVSYPLYLWHWPLLYFGRVLNPEGMSPLTVAGIMAASGLLATLTFVLVEKPLRFGSAGGTRKVFLLCSAMAGMLLLGLLTRAAMLPSRLGLNPFCRELARIAEERFYPFGDNFQRSAGFKFDAEIVRGRTDHAILFIGDSHMQHYWPRLAMLVARPDPDARPVLLLTAGGSPALPNVNRVQAGYACDKFFEFAMIAAAQPRVRTVVFSCFWENYFIGVFPRGDSPSDIHRVGDREKIPVRLGTPAGDEVIAEFGQAVRRLTRLGKEVVVLLPGPASSTWSPEEVSRLETTASVTRQVRVARADFEAFIRPVKQALIAVVAANGGRTIDPLDAFEEDGFFNGKTPEGRFRYRDRSHLRPFYVRERATFLDALVRGKAPAP